MSTDLSEYFQRFVVSGESNYYSHISMMDHSKYKIEQDELDGMYDVYCNALAEQPELVSSVLERSMEYTTIRGDFDMKIKKDEVEKLRIDTTRPFYSKEELDAIIQMFFDTIQISVKNIKEEQLFCFVLEKQTPYLDGENWKSGFHIEFPFLLMSKADQTVVLFPKLVKEYNELDIFSRFGEYQSGFFDSKVVNNAWLLYGSRKSVQAQSYKLTKIVNKQKKTVALEDVMRNRVLYNCQEEEIKLEKPCEYYLPRIMSIMHHGKKRYISRAVFSELSEAKSKFKKLKAIDKTLIEKAVATTPEERLKEVRELMPFLADTRADDFHTWMNIGWSLYNIGQGSQDALQIWIDFSRRTTKGNFSEATCVYEWGRMTLGNEKGFTIATIHYYAKMDDEAEYLKYCKSKSRNVVLTSIDKNGTLTPYCGAQALYYQHKNHFVYTDSRLWFHYENHKWNMTSEGIELRKRICDLIQPIQEEIDKIRNKIRTIEGSS